MLRWTKRAAGFTLILMLSFPDSLWAPSAKPACTPSLDEELLTRRLSPQSSASGCRALLAR